MDNTEKIDIIKKQKSITRTDIAILLASIGEPGEKREEKRNAVTELGKQNTQNIKLEDSLASYEEW